MIGEVSWEPKARRAWAYLIPLCLLLGIAAIQYGNMIFDLTNYLTLDNIDFVKKL